MKKKKRSDTRKYKDLSDIASEGAPETTELSPEETETNPHFRSELEYDGYQDIQEYDNDVYQANIDRRISRSIKIDDRREDHEVDMGEENLIDHQEHHKAG